MARFKTFDNDQVNPSGLVLPSDLNEVQDAYEEAFSTWKVVKSSHIELTNNTVTYESGTSATGAVVSSFPIDDDDFATAIGTPRAAVFRVKAAIVVNNVAPACNVHVGLRRITTVAAASGTPAATAFAETIDLAGADAVSVVTPAADAIVLAAGNAVAIATAGLYVLAAQLTASPPANSDVIVLAQLQMRQV